MHDETNIGTEGLAVTSMLDAGAFLFPSDLQVTPTRIRRVLLVGSCLTDHYHRQFQKDHPETVFDYFIFNSAGDAPRDLPAPIEDYDFQYLQLPIRTVTTDRIITQGRLSDPAFFDEIYIDGCMFLDAMLEAGLAHNKRNGLLTFVSNFFVPQMDVALCVRGRNGPQDLAALIRRFNQYLSDAIRPYDNVFLCDIDALAASLGKRFFLDDVTGFYTHGSIIEDFGTDRLPGARIDPVPPVETLFELRRSEIETAIYQQALATYRTVRQIDQVKAVIFDLDNTLWRGQIAEDYRPERAPWPFGGWQIGLWEAIQQLRGRGILVAICSKNDREVVERHWDNVVNPAFIKLEDFASVKINWKPKAENILEICQEFNVKPKSVLFVDDHPVERAAARSAMPDLRTIGSIPYLTRRILLWSPETQAATLTAESAGREKSIRGQIRRESDRATLSRDAFLAGLDCTVAFLAITDPNQAELGRVLELTNRTNQFNTTGKRWSHSDMLTFLATGGKIIAFKVKDRFSDYGLVGVLYLENSLIQQFVMSCRVMGMDVEGAALAHVTDLIRAGDPHSGPIVAQLIETADNSPCRDVFTRAGFIANGVGIDRYRLPSNKTIVSPAHIAVTAGYPFDVRPRGIPTPVAARPVKPSFFKRIFRRTERRVGL